MASQPGAGPHYEGLQHHGESRLEGDILLGQEREKTAKEFFKRNKTTLLDLLVVAIFTTVAIAVYMSFKNNLKSLTGLASIAAYALTQFVVAGLGPVIVMLIRKERFSAYGFVKKNTTLSLTIGLISIFVFLLLTYLIERKVQWEPLRRRMQW